MAEIQPIDPEIRLNQLLQDEAVNPAAAQSPGNASIEMSGNLFDDVLARAIDSLNRVSQTETYTNQVTESYLKGEAELHEVMVAQSKMNVMMQLAVTTVNTAVTTFKEVTQMQI